MVNPIFFRTFTKKLENMDKKRIEGIRSDLNALMSDAVEILKDMEKKAYEEREIDLLKPISNARKNIQEQKIKLTKELDKLSKMKSTW